jgi:hypothetical protein
MEAYIHKLGALAARNGKIIVFIKSKEYDFLLSILSADKRRMLEAGRTDLAARIAELMDSIKENNSQTW